MKINAIIFFLLIFFSLNINADENMVFIKGGIYKPLYKDRYFPIIKINSFKMDKYLVTNKDFYVFVNKNEKWNKNNISSLFASSNYLEHWQKKGNKYVPKEEDLKKPVTNVSWFAANAYCKSKNKRLPSINEWEYVVSFVPGDKKFKNRNEYLQEVLKEYLNRKEIVDVGLSIPNYYGIYNLHDLVWEWVDDINSIFASKDSRENGELNAQMFCGAGAINVRDIKDYPAFLRYAFRSSLNAKFSIDHLGFRCVK